MATWTIDIRVGRNETDGDIDRAREKARDMVKATFGVDRDPDDWDRSRSPMGGSSLGRSEGA
jgi:hypothetical protein